MMSQEEANQRGDEDEEGDIEARTAVAALLALTSPTDYTHTAGYEDDYIMEATADDYSPKDLSSKEPLHDYSVQPESLVMEYDSLEEERLIQAAATSTDPRVGNTLNNSALATETHLETSTNGIATDQSLAHLNVYAPNIGGGEEKKTLLDGMQSSNDPTKKSNLMNVSEASLKNSSASIAYECAKDAHNSTKNLHCSESVSHDATLKDSKTKANSMAVTTYKHPIQKKLCKDTLPAQKNYSVTVEKKSSSTGVASVVANNAREIVKKEKVWEQMPGKQSTLVGKDINTVHLNKMEKNDKAGAVVTENKSYDNSDDSSSESGSDDSDSDGESNSDSDSDSSSSSVSDEGSDSDSDSESESETEEKDNNKSTVPEVVNNKKSEIEDKSDGREKIVLDSKSVSDRRVITEKSTYKPDNEKYNCKDTGNSAQSVRDKCSIVEQSAAVTNEKVVRETLSKNQEKCATDDVESITNNKKDSSENSSKILAKEKKDVQEVKKSHVGVSSLPDVKISSSKNSESLETDLKKSTHVTSNNKESHSVQQSSNTENDKTSAKTANTSSEEIVKRVVTKAGRVPKLSKSPREKISEVDLVQQVAVAFAQQLSTIQANQLKALSEKHLNDEHSNSSENIGNTFPNKVSDAEDMTRDEDKLEMDMEDMSPMPIEAEVVMSEGSESGIEYEDFGRRSPVTKELGLYEKNAILLDPSDKENMEIMEYLQSFIKGSSEGEVVEYPPPNNDLPCKGSDLTQWQLDGVHLPPFTPHVAPPTWLRLTIPAEGYRCYSCGDTFFIESSLVQHRERRSVWIRLECGPCDAKLTFYNRCALKDHLRNHLLRGEEVDEETVEVRSLPLQLSRLLQPILVPVPKSLRFNNKIIPRSSSGCGAVDKLPVLKPIGKTTPNIRSEGYHSEVFDDNLKYEDDENNEKLYGDDYDADYFSIASDKMPSGIKRLTPRKRTVRCYLCERMFHSVRELMAHMRTDQPYSDQRVECRKCQLVLPSVCAAKAHILTHPPANTSNISVCPECGSRCDGPRDFVHHLNTCGHQFRRSGVVCTECQVCFFKSQDDFLTHWIAEHCSKSYECVVCRNIFESLVFHKCTSPGQQVLATFRCLLKCPMCSLAVQLHAQEEYDTNSKIKAHMLDAHPSILTRVHYVYKSKFCTNAFRSKDELRAHHDREHRRDNHYRTKTCTLHHEVLGYQHQYFGGQEPRNAFVTLPVALSAEELHEAQIRDVPTVSSVIDKTLFPDASPQENGKTGKCEKQTKNKSPGKEICKELEFKEPAMKDCPAKKDLDQLDRLKPTVCYRCGFAYLDNKDFRKHKRTCEGEATERQCQICDMNAVGEDFARHCLGHIQDGMILCIYCNGTLFNSLNDLEQHFELHVHEQFSYPAICAFCYVSLPDVPTALAHLNEEHDPLHVPFDTSEFECDRCGRRFHGERGLSVHLGRCALGTSTPTPSTAGCRQCQVCTKALTPEMFGRHMVCHLEEGLLVCSLCDGRTLPSSMALLHHLEEHAAALSYPTCCPMCALSMADTNSALTHLKEEHGFGNLHCADCEMPYNFTYQLQRHTDIVHKICQYAKRRYICWICRAYDHVKKETLMNHFRTVHGLDREQVDEKAMIRTRGQGTMPTSQFIPTKPLGSKENQGLPATSKTANTLSPKLQKEKTKSSPSKASSVSESSVVQQNVKSVQDLPNSPNSPDKHSSPVKVKKSVKKKDDSKLQEKTKVLIKRLPDSVLDQQSRSKRRKVAKDSVVQPNSDGARDRKEERKRKKKKAYWCTTCGYGTNSKEKHAHHILKHRVSTEEAEAEGFVCLECGASFVVEPSLARHMFFAHKIKFPVQDETKDSSKQVNECKSQQIMIKKDENSKLKNETLDIKEKHKVESTREGDEPKNGKEERGQKNMKQEKKIKTVKEGKNEVKKVKQESRKPVQINVKKKLERESLFKREELTNKINAKKKVEKENIVIRSEGGNKRKVVRNAPQKKLIKLTDKKPIAKETNKKKVVVRKKIIKKVDEDTKIDNHCVVCKEEFLNPVELYSHLRTHGMAFLKLGRKARSLTTDKIS